MRRFTTRLAAAVLPIVFAGITLVQPALAQSKPDRRQVPAIESSPDIIDAQRTRQALIQLLEKHPPSVARVLKMDPSLMHNESYLTAYPTLRDFLAEHPEIPQNAGFYFEQVYWDGYGRPRDMRVEMMEAVLAGLAGFTAAGIVLGTLIWVMRTALEQRRWNRLSKIQADVHTKLLDRFSTNEELLAYVQTPSGKRFLEMGPSPLADASPAMSAPFSRILWSVQLGSVMLVTGLTLQFLSVRPSWPEAREVFYFTGCIGSALGAGFLVSAAASYLLSRRLGLLDRPTTSNA